MMGDKDSNPDTYTIKTAGDVGRVIRERRKEYNITQKQAAGMCNVGIRFLSELENGKPTLEFDKIMRVLQAFGFQCMIKGRG